MNLTPEELTEEESSNFFLEEFRRLMEEDEQKENQGDSPTGEGHGDIPAPTEEDGQSPETELPPSAIPELRNDVPKCPVCEAELVNDHCKLVCKSQFCISTVIQNCNEY